MPSEERPKVIIIVGATASGKSSLAIDIAAHFNGEVVSADSRQVYRGLNIGTAKVTEDEMREVPHHLLDVAEPNEIYTAADFKRDAEKAIENMRSREKLPVIAGGTFFYIDVLRGASPLPDTPPNPELRAYLEDLSTDLLYQQLTQKDPERAAAIDQHNRRRLIRALEIVETHGAVPKPQAQTEQYHTLWIGIDRSKEELRERYRGRAVNWLDGSFEREVENLLASGVTRDRLKEIGFEYQLMLDYMDGTLSENEFITRCIEKNWQYAKRQLTWLKRNNEIIWLTPDKLSLANQHIQTFLK